METVTHKTCTNCGHHGEVDKDFTRTLSPSASRPPTKIGDWHSRCKKCRSDINARVRLERLLEEQPHLYVECPECDHIYNKCHAECRKCKREK